jgi:hypothetical protein
MMSLSGDDNRFGSIYPEDIDAITLKDAMTAVMSQLVPSELEMSMVGDFDVKETLEAVRRYIGTIPEDTNVKFREDASTSSPEREMPRLSTDSDDTTQLPPEYKLRPLELPGKHLDIELPDSDPRAVAHVAGAAPNNWGIMENGDELAELVIAKDGIRASKFDAQRRRHPLFAHCALALVSEIINRRLFSNVREKRQLTYVPGTRERAQEREPRNARASPGTRKRVQERAATDDPPRGLPPPGESSPRRHLFSTALAPCPPLRPPSPSSLARPLI